MWRRTINKFIKITPSFVTLQNTTHIDVVCPKSHPHLLKSPSFVKITPSFVQNAWRKYYLPSGPITSGFRTFSKCIPGLFAFIACNMVGKRSYASAQSPWMSFSARYFVCHAIPYFTRYPHATIATLINVVTVNNGQFLMMLTSLYEMNPDNSLAWFISSTFIKQV
jgi:hypothetical protein